MTTKTTQRPFELFVVTIPRSGTPYDWLVRASSPNDACQRVRRRRGVRHVSARPAKPSDMNQLWLWKSDRIAHAAAAAPADLDRLRILVAEGDRYGAHWKPQGDVEMSQASRMHGAGWIFTTRFRGSLCYRASAAGRLALAEHDAEQPNE